MLKTKFFATFLIVLAVLFGQVGGVLAAPATQDTTPIEGTITGIRTQTADGETTVLVTVEDALGVSQTYRLSLEDAVALNLVTVDGTTVTVNDAQIEQPISFDSTLVIADEEPFNPVAGMLATFFDVTNTEINQYHEDGYGFGVIAQALWMAQGLEETNPGITADLILKAKVEKNFDAFVLPDGSTPTNWGQFKKAALGKDKKNLGVIMSGHADNDETTTQNGRGNGNGNGNNGNGNHGNGNNGNGGGNNP